MNFVSEISMVISFRSIQCKLGKRLNEGLENIAQYWNLLSPDMSKIDM